VSFLAVFIATPALGSSAKVWVGRVQEFEEVLANGDIVDVKDLGEGRNHPQKITLSKNGLELHGIWKPIERGRHDWAWETYQAEVVAYQLDQLLGLNMVPPTVVREIGEQKGSLQLWIEGAQLLKDVPDKPPDTVAWERQLDLMKFFDCLICNPDRHDGNMLVDADWNVILIDHSQCFLSDRHLEKNPDAIPMQFDRRLVKKLKYLGPASLRLHFHNYLMDSQVDAILARRDALMDHIEKLIAEKGEDAVLY
jgi:hypothetical protein